MRRRASNTVVSPALLAAEDLASVDVAILSKKTRRNTKLRIQNAVLLLSWESHA